LELPGRAVPAGPRRDRPAGGTGPCGGGRAEVTRVTSPHVGPHTGHPQAWPGAGSLCGGMEQYVGLARSGSSARLGARVTPVPYRAVTAPVRRLGGCDELVRPTRVIRPQLRLLRRLRRTRLLPALR